jgi:hypothetical protein
MRKNMNLIHKILALLMVLIASMALVACSTTDEESSSGSDPETPQEELRDEMDFDPDDGAG